MSLALGVLPNILLSVPVRSWWTAGTDPAEVTALPRVDINAELPQAIAPNQAGHSAARDTRSPMAAANGHPIATSTASNLQLLLLSCRVDLAFSKWAFEKSSFFEQSMPKKNVVVWT